MTMNKKLLFAATVMAPAAFAATHANAQVSGIAVADPEGAVANSRAWATARTQIQGTYKAQLDQATTRRQAIAAELQPLVTAYQTAARAPGASETSLRPQAQAIQTKEQAGQTELARLTEPAQRAQAYAIEQISAKLPDAINAVVKARNISLLLRPDAAMFAQPAVNVTAAVTTELDRMVPSVSTTPPAGWQPGQNQAAGAQPAPARTQPKGR